jgi:hypothetical protein
MELRRSNFLGKCSLVAKYHQRKDCQPARRSLSSLPSRMAKASDAFAWHESPISTGQPFTALSDRRSNPEAQFALMGLFPIVRWKAISITGRSRVASRMGNTCCPESTGRFPCSSDKCSEPIREPLVTNTSTTISTSSSSASTDESRPRKASSSSGWHSSPSSAPTTYERLVRPQDVE